ncbi:toprim domain-containing protein [Runella sp.]|uniref:toprim domain-containing protein n=1 Tax=Runella sp. TaxID=1960881 RepID=UPI00301A451E
MERQQINTLKSLSIESYLQSAGIEPAKIHGQKLYYHSPFRSDSTPSFVINLDSNTFKDFADDEKPEDIFRLVQRLHGLNFNDACQHLEKWSNSTPSTTFFSKGKEVIKNTKAGIEILKVKPLENKALIDYLNHKRGIPFDVASQYVKECYFKVNDKNQFAICFENDLKGLELRNAYVKLSTNPKTITSHQSKDGSTVLLFEGFMDFLSYVVLKGKAVTSDVIVLNSTVNLPDALPILKKVQKVYSFLDNDPTGDTTTAKIKAEGLNLIDGRKYYQGYKDLNEYLTNKPK